MMALAQSTIKQFGDQLIIKSTKSYIYTFEVCLDGKLDFERVLGHEGQGKNGIEYLGFRFDGKRVYIRDATLANLWRKVTRAAKREAIAAAKRYPNKSASEIKAAFNYEKFTKGFGRVEEFELYAENVKTWTFWTYAQRASKIFGDVGKPIMHQLSRQKRIITEKLNQAIDEAILKRGA